MSRFRPIGLAAVAPFTVAAVTAAVLREFSDAHSTDRGTAGVPTSAPCDPPTGGAEPRSPDGPQATLVAERGACHTAS